MNPNNAIFEPVPEPPGTDISYGLVDDTLRLTQGNVDIYMRAGDVAELRTLLGADQATLRELEQRRMENARLRTALQVGMNALQPFADYGELEDSKNDEVILAHLSGSKFARITRHDFTKAVAALAEIRRLSAAGEQEA